MTKQLFSHSGQRFRRPFTQEEIDFLKKKASQRIEIQSLAIELNISPVTLQSRAKRLGIKFYGRDSWHPSDDNALLEDYKNCFSIDQLAKKYRKNSRFIRKKLNELGETVPLNVFYLPLAKENALLKKQGLFKCRFCRNLFKVSERVYGKNYCKPCQSDSLKKRYEKQKSNLTLESLLAKRLHGAKFRAKQKGVTFNLDLPFLIDLYQKQQGLCAYSKQMMAIALNKTDSISIDRVDSSFGYTKDNVCLAWAIVNSMKGDLSVENFKKICRLIV